MLALAFSIAIPFDRSSLGDDGSIAHVTFGSIASPVLDFAFSTFTPFGGTAAIGFVLYANGVNTTPASSSPIDMDAPHTFTATVTPTHVTAYIDGELVLDEDWAPTAFDFPTDTAGGVLFEATPSVNAFSFAHITFP